MRLIATTAALAALVLLAVPAGAAWTHTAAASTWSVTTANTALAQDHYDAYIWGVERGGGRLPPALPILTDNGGSYTFSLRFPRAGLHDAFGDWLRSRESQCGDEDGSGVITAAELLDCVTRAIRAAMTQNHRRWKNAQRPDLEGEELQE